MLLNILKYGTSSSITVVDYDTKFKKFRIIARIEVPKAEYSYDRAVQLICEVNDVYNPSWIYCDRGAGNIQINRFII